MSNFQKYTLIYARIGGALLTEETKCSARRMTNAQVIKTVAKGFAGMSPGAPMMEIDVDNAVPAADFEFDPGDNMLALEPIELCLEAAGKQCIAKGYVTEDGIQHAVDTPSGLSFKVICQFGVWE